jgi:hypothetical protein
LGGDRWGNKSRSASKRLYEGYFSSGADDTLFLLTVKPEDFPVFQVHQAIISGFCHPNSTKQAHFKPGIWRILPGKALKQRISKIMFFIRHILRLNSDHSAKKSQSGLISCSVRIRYSGVRCTIRYIPLWKWLQRPGIPGT